MPEKEEICIKINRREVLNYNYLQIDGINENNFWDHHGRTFQEKENLKQLCYTALKLQKLIENQNFDFTTTSKEEYNAYVSFYGGKSPLLSYNPYVDKIVVSDGRHRMAMCKELNIPLVFNVSYYLPFERLRNKEQGIKNTLLNILRPDKQRKQSYSYIGIKENPVINKLIPEIQKSTDIIRGSTYDDDFLVIPYSRLTLDELLEHLKTESIEEDVFVSSYNFKGKEPEL